MELRCELIIRGTSTPDDVEDTSSIADELATAPVLFTARPGVWAWVTAAQNVRTTPEANARKTLFFILNVLVSLKNLLNNIFILIVISFNRMQYIKNSQKPMIFIIFLSKIFNAPYPQSLCKKTKG
jgi:hypothetical protein